MNLQAARHLSRALLGAVKGRSSIGELWASTWSGRDCALPNFAAAAEELLPLSSACVAIRSHVASLSCVPIGLFCTLTKHSRSRSLHLPDRHGEARLGYSMTQPVRFPLALLMQTHRYDIRLPHNIRSCILWGLASPLSPPPPPPPPHTLPEAYSLSYSCYPAAIIQDGTHADSVWKSWLDLSQMP